MKQILKTVLILITTLGNAQNKEEPYIFRKIIEREVEKGSTNIHILCEKSKTTFNPSVFKEETYLNVPKNILTEIETNSKKSNNKFWNSDLINELYNTCHFINKNCLTKREVEDLVKNTNTKQNIIAISDPIFDNNYENCIVTIAYWKFAPKSYGNKYFLKKVYGVWTILTDFNHSGN